MIATLWALSLMFGAAPDAAPVTPASVPRIQLGAISLRVPLMWVRRARTGSTRFDSPKGDAYFVVDMDDVKTAGMEPSVCVGKITEALGADGGEWHKLMLGGFPAAHRSSVDVAKGGGLTVRTHTFVGCDGVHTWSLLFHLDEKATQQYEPEVVAVAKSLEFVNNPGPEATPPREGSAVTPAPKPGR